MEYPRCADPALQSEVDVMIIDYLLYRVLKAFFESVNPPPPSSGGSVVSVAERIHAYQDELYSFDLFMRNFRARNPSHELDAGTRWSIQLLELILLLQQHREYYSSAGTAGTTTTTTKEEAKEDDDFVLSAKSHRLECKELRGIIQQRRAWSKARIRSRSHLRSSTSARASTEAKDTDTENAIFRAWADYKPAASSAPAAPSGRANGRQQHSLPLFGVLHRFMDLTAEIADAMGTMREKMMQLMCNLMLQVALQVLSSPSEDGLASGSDIPGPQLPTLPTPSLSDIFAYGYVTTDDHTTQMFSYIPGGASVSSPQSQPDQPDPRRSEIPAWNELRHRTILEFHTSSRYAGGGDDSTPTERQAAFSARLARLKQKYPYAPVEAELLRCLEHFWTLNHHPDMRGKPVLKQVEEGNIQGLSKEESIAFLERCGIDPAGGGFGDNSSSSRRSNKKQVDNSLSPTIDHAYQHQHQPKKWPRYSC